MRRVGALLAAAMLAPLALTSVASGAGSSAASACRVLADERADVGSRKVAGYGDDIVAVWLDGEDDDVLAVEIEVSALAARASARGERWALTWVNPWLDDGRALQSAVADRSSDGVTFVATSGKRSWTVAGSLDPTRDVVRMLVPRAPLLLKDGALLEQVQARSFMVAGDAAHERDATASTDWAVGAGCETPVVQQCPVVVDAAGDAGIGADGRTQVDPSLDIRAVGAAPAGEMLELSVRVASASPPPGAEARRAGLTISWHAGGQRWFAQAERYESGDVFRYGRAAGRGPTLSGGARAAGRFDGRLLRIWVPRARVGIASDEDVLFDVTAWSWLLAGPDGPGPYHTADDTAARRAIAGVACRA